LIVVAVASLHLFDENPTGEVSAEKPPAAAVHAMGALVTASGPQEKKLVHSNWHPQISK